DLAIHDIAIFNHWLGKSPVRVQCQGSSWLQPGIPTPLSPHGLADMVWCRLQYPSGFQATIHLCWANPDKQRRLCVVGDRATLIFDEMNREQPLVEQRGSFAEQDGWLTPQQMETVPVKLPASEPLGNVCEHFIQCVEKGVRSPVSSGEIGTELVAVLVALSKSLEGDGQWTDCMSKTDYMNKQLLL
ncbi:MAG: Gfo/Idh/MocA family oxidoreductase, partial [Phormidesmis sp.]